MNLPVILAQAVQTSSSQVSRIGINLVPLLFFILFTGLPILAIIWLIRYLIRAARERKRLRLELAKLAEEVHLLRQQMTPTDDPTDLE